MKTPSPGALTKLLKAWSRGDVAARDQLLPLVYDELRRRAARCLRRAEPGQTLQATSLVNEAYLRLSSQNPGWKNRAHFFAVASQVMRWILVDHARARHSAKRLATMVTLEDEADSQPRALDIVYIDEALNELAMADPQQAQMVELRFFGGLTHEEVASTLGVSLRTVKRQWRLTRAWLQQRVAQERVN
jgi:RNA polymerase sigma factor (TIGR02999 family)